MAREKLELKIIKVTTKIEDDRFKRAGDVGNSGMFSTPKQFIVNYECETVVRGYNEESEKVYFTHRFEFSETMSRVGGMYHCRKESEFVIYFEGKKDQHKGGLRGDENYFTMYGKFYSKFQEGERIRIKASMEHKTSKVGNKYIQLKRVKLDRDYCFHSFVA